MLLALLTLACGSAPAVDRGGQPIADAGTVGADAGAPDAGAPDAGPFDPSYPAARPSPPQVSSLGGAVMGSPHIVAVFFPNDTAKEVVHIQQFLQALPGSDYWTQTVGEYGVGPIDGVELIRLADAAPASLEDSPSSAVPGDRSHTQLQHWLVGQISAGNLPAAAPRNLYIVFFPASSKVNIDPSVVSCAHVGGWHMETTSGSERVRYAVVPRCKGNSPGMTTEDIATDVASHELVEAATDPLPFSDPAYAQLDDAHAYLGDVLLNELGDLCTSEPGSSTNKLPGMPYMVQRTWSNQSIASGRDPCVPELPGEIYFSAVPELPDVVTYFGRFDSNDVRAVKVPIGHTVTIPLDLYSSRPLSTPWHVEALDLETYQGSSGSALTFSLDKSTGLNGDHLQLTIGTKADASTGSHAFVVLSTLGGAQHTAWGLVNITW